jgi:hypothetical protein
MMFDAEGRQRIRLGVDQRGLPSLELLTAVEAGQSGNRDPRSVPRLALECVPDPFGAPNSVPVVSLFDLTGNYQAALVAEPGGGSALTFYGDRGRSFGWSLHSKLGLTRYTSSAEDKRLTLAKLWEVEKLMWAVRKGGKIPAPGMAERLMSAYEGLLI